MLILSDLSESANAARVSPSRDRARRHDENVALELDGVRHDAGGLSPIESDCNRRPLSAKNPSAVFHFDGSVSKGEYEDTIYFA